MLEDVLKYKRWVCSSDVYGFILHRRAWMGLWEVILFEQDGESPPRQALGLGPFSSITSLEMKNLVVICSNCSGAEKLLTPPIHRCSFSPRPP